MVGFSELPSEITVLVGLGLGFITSFHCVGMCGPIALSLPLHGSTKWKKLLGGILYNLGRTVTYALMGLAFGLVGQGLSTLGFQKIVSIVAGIVMISTALFPALFKSSSLDSNLFSFVSTVRSSLKKLFSSKSYVSLFSIGILNGLLPCGPLYYAVIISTGTGNAVESVFFMILFGLGTIPLLLAISIAGNFISINLRNRINNFFPIIMIIMGVLFILRGLSLNIPFLSPPDTKLEKVKKMGGKTLHQRDKQKDTLIIDSDSLGVYKMEEKE